VAESKTLNEQLGGQRYNLMWVLPAIARWLYGLRMDIGVFLSKTAFNDLPGCTDFRNMWRNGLIMNILLDYGYWVNM
jgi:hypothetical protein